MKTDFWDSIGFLILIGFLAWAVFKPTTPAYAHSGCCSHHEGVCGCACCDGKPLSEKCAPYYLECS